MNLENSKILEAQEQLKQIRLKQEEAYNKFLPHLTKANDKLVNEQLKEILSGAKAYDIKLGQPLAQCLKDYKEDFVVEFKIADRVIDKVVIDTDEMLLPSGKKALIANKLVTIIQTLDRAKEYLGE